MAIEGNLAYSVEQWRNGVTGARGYQRVLLTDDGGEHATSATIRHAKVIRHSNIINGTCTKYWGKVHGH